MVRAEHFVRRGLLGAVGLALILGALPAVSAGDDTAKALKTAMQSTKSKMMSLQIDKAVDQFKQATELLGKLKTDEPGHKDLADLQKQYDKLTADLAKKVVQRAEKAFKPAISDLEKKLEAGDADQLQAARDALAKALVEHEENLKVAGGSDGTALLERVQSLVAQEKGESKATPAKTEPSPEPKSAEKPKAAPADVKTLMSDIQHKFRDARSLSTPELVKLAAEIRELIAQLEAAEPGHAKIAEFKKRIEKMVSEAYADDIREARNEFELRNRQIEMYLERNNESERPQLKEQRDLLAKAAEDHRDALLAAGDEGKELLQKMKETLKKADERIGVALAGDTLVNDWIAKLKVYQWDGEKDITDSVNGPAAYATIRTLRAEAEQLLKECKQVDFGAARTQELDSAVEALQRAIATADEHLTYAISSRKEQAEQSVQQIEERFAKDQAWKQDKSQMPKSFASVMLDQARRAVDDLASYVSDDPAVADLNKRMAKLAEENKARQEARKAATLMKPNKYEGADAKELQEFAAKLIGKKHKGAKVLRVTIFTPEWKEETVTEWTDTTHTAIHTRTTRELMVCLATEHSDGVFRMFGYLNQDRKSDGGWSSTYGHLTDTRDPMLKDNVKKDETE